MKLLKIAALAVAMGGITTIMGCASVSTAIEKKDLSVQTKMSDTIFLEPVSTERKTVFLQFRNTSDKEINAPEIQSRLEKTLQQKGYKLVSSPQDATFLVQQNILSVAKTNKDEAYSAMHAGFGGAVVGGALGGLAGNSGNYGHSATVGGLIGAGIGIAANALVKDVYFNMVTDLQIKQRAPKGQKVDYVQTASAQSGSSANLSQTLSGQSDWITYRTRIVSVANQVNLEFIEAQKQLEDKLIRSTTGIF